MEVSTSTAMTDGRPGRGGSGCIVYSMMHQEGEQHGRIGLKTHRFALLLVALKMSPSPFTIAAWNHLSV
jgi:hypothetical protein